MAVYFEEMTKHAKALQRESEAIEEKNRNDNKQSYSALVSHEFATPVSTAITLIKTALEEGLEAEKLHETLLLVLVQMNLVYMLIRDMQDFHAIAEGKFATACEEFDPLEVFKLVL